MYRLQIASHEPIDQRWYQKLCDATDGITETFILLMPDQEQLATEREKFFSSGCKIRPNIRPGNLDRRTLDRAADRLANLQVEIQDTEPHPYIREAYMRHIQDYVTDLELLLAVANEDHAAYMAHNIALYGMPDKEIFAAVCAWIRHDTEAAPGLIFKGLSAAVLRLVPDMGGDPSVILPNEKVFQAVRQMHFASGGYFDQLFAPVGMPDSGYIEQQAGDDITRRAIANVGADYDIQSADDGLWAVLSRSRKVVRPPGYRVDRDYFIGVIAHEIGSHLLEEANGAKQPLRLLGLGLNGFEKGNEGRAFLREQIVYADRSVCTHQSSWEYILLLHLGVSLAAGLHDKPYDFPQLYAVLYALHRFWRQRRYPLDTNNDAQAQVEAWHLAVRIMKGTDGTGGCYMKDTVYLEGNLGCWLLAEHDPGLLLYGDVGKFNITDPEHIALLRALNIIPEIGQSSIVA